MSNHLKNQTSPYLLQHADNPVDWYPWGPEAFEKAKAEDKPIFLSIGYSTCHWCHVMAHESFEDPEIAGILNRYFVSVKVDKEERPDIDSIYMRVCEAFTGSGGWPTSIFMTAEQKPFFAGTYFPKTARYGLAGLKEILLAIREKWENDRKALLRPADQVISLLKNPEPSSALPEEALLKSAVELYRRSFDEAFGGFGNAPKFPSPHNLLFLMQQYAKHGHGEALQMAETTLRSMYAGGLFDHIGYGFCRYSTDRFYLVPHFEKMLYDNALLILAYCRAYEITKEPLYQKIAEKTAGYILREMTGPEGGFASAQDADSDGEEGKYYVFTPEEITKLLGEKEGAAFNEHFGITPRGNFEGKSIPNLLHAKDLSDDPFDRFLPKIREYRQSRTHLHKDDKYLTSWNALMIAAFCALYQNTRNPQYLETAKRAQEFVETALCENDTLTVSFRSGKRGEKGFLDDYASYIFALLFLYRVTLEPRYLSRAESMTGKAVSQFYDAEHGGFTLYGAENEQLIFRPKECYDGAIPSGNSLMAYDLVRLNALIPNEKTEEILKKQLAYQSGEAKKYPAGYAMFLMALSDYLDPPMSITAVGDRDDLAGLPFVVPSDAVIRILDKETGGYRLLNGETAFYVCHHRRCDPPVNRQGLMELLSKTKGNQRTRSI